MVYINSYNEYILNENIFKSILQNTSNIKAWRKIIEKIEKNLENLKDTDIDIKAITDKAEKTRQKREWDKLKLNYTRDLKDLNQNIDDERNSQKKIYTYIFFIAGTMIVIGGIGGAIRALSTYFDNKWKQEVERKKNILRDPDDPNWKKQDKDNKYAPGGMSDDKSTPIIDLFLNAIKYISTANENEFVDALVAYGTNKTPGLLINIFSKIEKDKKMIALINKVENNKTYISAINDIKKLNNYITIKYGKPTQEDLKNISKYLPKLFNDLKKISK